MGNSKQYDCSKNIQLFCGQYSKAKRLSLWQQQKHKILIIKIPNFEIIHLLEQLIDLLLAHPLTSRQLPNKLHQILSIHNPSLTPIYMIKQVSNLVLKLLLKCRPGYIMREGLEGEFWGRVAVEASV